MTRKKINMETKVNIGSIIQIRPDAGLENCWQGVLLTVEEIKKWGVLAFALSPSQGLKAQAPGRFYMRLTTGQFDMVGAAQYLPADVWEKLPAIQAILFSPIGVEGA